MRTSIMSLIRPAAATLGMLAVAAAAWADRVEKTVTLDDGTKITYQIITPEGFKDGQAAPVLLVFPPGDQGANMVNAGLRYFDPECRKRAWVVVSPQAPARNELYYQGGEAHIPGLLTEVRKVVIPEGGKFHVAGASNGGISALRFAIEHPEMVLSVTALPGLLAKGDERRLDRLMGIPVRMFVGSDDLVEWTDASRRAFDAGKNAGLDITLDVRGAQGHVIGNLGGEELFNMLDGFRKSEGTLSPDQAAAGAVLDEFHRAASRADFDGYFRLFAPEGVFIGTDASERWTVAEFKAYAKPHFDKGTGWTYHPRDRHIDLSRDRQMAWFDELLDHDKYGVCRGTGVLRRVGKEWLVCQYHLTVPVPNDLMERVVRMIKAGEKRK